ncbi:hypothetical protein [Pseudomonas sp. O230]|uniref:hypothetical protein n=1 Tax=Pseudomonas sp. O230 TaxID=3159450 RepID=UPI00387AB0E4
MTSKLKIEAAELPPVSPVSPVYFCYGASGGRGHTFTAIGEATSPWVGHGVSVNPASGQTLPFQTVPAPGVYQVFSEQGSEWKINCPDDGEEIALDCWLQTEFTAVPCSIAVRLGHYLREFLGKRNPLGAPLIGDEVTAEVQVVSAYTKKSLQDVEVQWFVGGEPAGTRNTNDLGWSTFSHTFVTDGEQSITAKVFSPYDDTWVEHNFPVKVYRDSPWQQAELKVNGLPVAWRSLLVLRRGQANEVTMKVDPQIARTLKLTLVNNEGLSIDTEPADDVWHVPDPVSGEFKWKITSNEEKSGRVTLVFVSREVIQPWNHDCRVLADNFADEVKVLVGGEPVALDSNFFFRRQPRFFTLAPKEGRSVIEGLAVTLTYVITSGLDPADLKSGYAFGLPTLDHRWNVIGSNNSGTFQLIFTCQGIAVPLTLAVNALLSTDLNDEADVRIGGVEPEDGQVFFRNEAQTLTVVAKPGSPLGRLPLKLQWIKGEGLRAEDFTCEPALDTYATVHSWNITGPADKSGTFQLELVAQGMSTSLLLPTCILLSSNLADEVDIKIDGQNITGNGVAFLRKRTRKIQLVAKSTSPIDKLPLMMKCEIVSGITPGTIKSTPAFGSEVLSREWEVGCVSLGEGLFRLEVSCPLQSGSLYIDCRQIDIWYTVAGQSIELVDGVGLARVNDKGAHIFVAQFSDSAVGHVVKIAGGGMMHVSPSLPLDYTVGPSKAIRLDVNPNLYTGDNLFTFKFAGLNDYADQIVIRVEQNNSALLGGEV